MKLYKGRIPACGVFCGGCPTYTRKKNPCLGAELNKAHHPGLFFEGTRIAEVFQVVVLLIHHPLFLL